MMSRTDIIELIADHCYVGSCGHIHQAEREVIDYGITKIDIADKIVRITTKRPGKIIGIKGANITVLADKLKEQWDATLHIIEETQQDVTDEILQAVSEQHCADSSFDWSLLE